VFFPAFYEEKMREKKNEMSERGCMCVVGEKKKERLGAHGWWGKKKKKIKRKKEMESGVHVYGRKKGEWKRKKKKKLNWFYLYVHFVWCKV
jgi:hypothetical protein